MHRPVALTRFAVITAMVWFCFTAGAEDASYALQFDGVDDYVQITAANALPPVGNASVTIEGWVNVTEFNPNGAMILGWGPEGYLRTHFLMIGISHIYYSHWGADFAYSPGVQTGVWNHIAAVHDGSVNNDIVYLNGVPLGTNSTPPLQAISSSVFMARHPNVNGYFFAGMLDEVRIWNVARTPDEIRATLYKPLAGPRPGLIARWGFDEGSGATTADSSGTGATAVLCTPPTWISSTAPFMPRLYLDLLSSQQVRLHWSIHSPPVAVETNADVLVPSAWSVATNRPNVNGSGSYEVIMGVGDPHLFFRLRGE